jgi:hypothetical protein
VSRHLKPTRYFLQNALLCLLHSRLKSNEYAGCDHKNRLIPRVLHCHDHGFCSGARGWQNHGFFEGACMKCPHCTKGIHSKLSSVALGNGDRNHYWAAFYEVCPECGHLIIWLGRGSSSNVEPDMLVYPRGTSRPPLPPEVPERFGRDYVEASLVLADSPKASAALSRRTLQNILREKAKVTAGNLSSEIDKVLSSGSLPSYLSSSIAPSERWETLQLTLLRTQIPAKLSRSSRGRPNGCLMS